MAKATASIKEIEDAIDSFVRGLPTLQKQYFDNVYFILKGLSLDADGRIKPTIDNLKAISKVKNELSGLTDASKLQDKVEGLNPIIEKVSQVQTQYYDNVFQGFTKPGAIKQLNKLTFDSLTDQLIGAGMNENVVNTAASIVEDGIRSQASFYDMTEELKQNMLGDKESDPKMLSYSKQVINDTLSNHARNYHNIVTAALDLQWFMYVGSLVETSRPFCRELVKKKYIHISEFPAICRGNINGHKVSLQGLYPDTNKDTFVSNAGGWNCSHQVIPVPASTVPASIRKKFEDKNTSEIELDA